MDNELWIELNIQRCFLHKIIIIFKETKIENIKPFLGKRGNFDYSKGTM